MVGGNEEFIGTSRDSVPAPSCLGIAIVKLSSAIQTHRRISWHYF